jgi:hypothetical protein
MTPSTWAAANPTGHLTPLPASVSSEDYVRRYTETAETLRSSWRSEDLEFELHGRTFSAGTRSSYEKHISYCFCIVIE